METTSKLGMNRTGIQMSPFDVKKMQSAAEASGGAIESPPRSQIRESYMSESDLIGSVPIPASVSGMLETAKEAMTGHRPQVLMDKLGERLAFERSGVRLYEALLSKCIARLDEIPEDMLDTLVRFKDEELQHFKLVHDALLQLGGDPTAETPCATIAGVESMGLVKVLTDPRTTIPQCLHAILSAELIDNTGWEGLVELTRQLGQDALAEQFEEALLDENTHLDQVKEWVLRATVNEALQQSEDTRVTH